MGDTQGMSHSEVSCSLLLSLLFLKSQTLSLSQSFPSILSPPSPLGLGVGGWQEVGPAFQTLFPCAVISVSRSPSGPISMVVLCLGPLLRGFSMGAPLLLVLCAQAYSCGTSGLEFHAGGSLGLWWAGPYMGSLGLL